MRKLQFSQIPVYCLHIRKYRETSVILQCLSKEHGRFDLVGKGLYRPKNKNDLPEYFQKYSLSGICRAELGTLTELELIESGKKLVGQLWLTACYANELLLKFLPRLEPVPELFSAYESLLVDFQSTDNYQISLLWFEKRILDVLGYGINFHYAAHTDDPIDSEAWYQYQVSNGFHLCMSTEKYALPGSLIMALAGEYWTEKETPYFGLAKRVVRSALKYQLGDVSLRTVSVSKDLQQFVQI